MHAGWQSRVVALTGVIGSGKTAVAAILARLGAFCVDADELARRVVEPGTPGLQMIADEFGDDLLRSDGSLDRERLAATVFSDDEKSRGYEKKKRLEAITHPLIAERTRAKFEAAFLERYPLYVYECPLLFEAGLDADGFRSILVVSSDRETCLERITQRSAETRQDAIRRLDSQLPIAEKVAQAQIVIDNAGSLDDLESDVKRHYVFLTEGAPGKHGVVGGTFDHFHLGHRALLERGFEGAQRLTIAVTAPNLVTHKPRAELIEPLADRVLAVAQWVDGRGWTDRSRIVHLHDTVGAASFDPGYHLIVVTPETEPNANKMNERRASIGLPPLQIEIIEPVPAGDGRPVSSSRIRSGEIDVDGTVFMSARLSSQVGPDLVEGEVAIGVVRDLATYIHSGPSFDPARQQMLSDVAGPDSTSHRLITVGEAATRLAMDTGLLPWISVLGREQIDQPESRFRNLVPVRSPEDAIEACRRALDGVHDSTLIDSDLPEELVTLWIVLLAPLETRIACALGETEIALITVRLDGKRQVRQALDTIGDRS